MAREPKFICDRCKKTSDDKDYRGPLFEIKVNWVGWKDSIDL